MPMRLILRLALPSVLAAISMLSSGCAATTEGDGAEGTVDSDLSSGNAKTAFEYFVGKGLTEIQSAGIVGNLQQESNVNPNAVQPGGPGRGIAQWSVGARWNVTRHDNLASYAAEHGGSMHSLDIQLGFIWYELENDSQYGLAALRRATTINDAVYAFQKDFEACGTCNATHRISYAKAALKAYGN
jgi:hypothetical protein